MAILSDVANLLLSTIPQNPDLRISPKGTVDIKLYFFKDTYSAYGIGQFSFKRANQNKEFWGTWVLGFLLSFFSCRGKLLLVFLNW